MIRFIIGMATGILLLEALLALEDPRPTVVPLLPIHTYNAIFTDGTQTAIVGNRITTAGACVEVWLGGRVDTIVCGVRWITEAVEGPAETEDEPTATPDSNPNREARR